MQFTFAIIGLMLEIYGLWILLGKDDNDKLRALSRKKLDGLDEWQDEIDGILELQRKRHLRSSFVIVAGICLQTFPEYFFQYLDCLVSIATQAQ